MFVWLLVAFAFLLSLSKIKISILNKETTNYVKFKFYFFTLNLDYNRFIKTIKKIGFKNDIGIKKQIENYIEYNPIVKDVLKQIVIERANFYKFFDEYGRTYEIITYYLLSSYFNGFCEFSFKKLNNYSYEVLYSDTREDLDFIFKANIRISRLFYTLIKNIKILFKHFIRRDSNGS